MYANKKPAFWADSLRLVRKIGVLDEAIFQELKTALQKALLGD